MPVKLALIGAGHMGKIHLQKLLSMTEVEVAGIVDIDENTRNALACSYTLRAEPEYTCFFDCVDGVVISTPTEYHFEVARNFLARGTHVFIEKPITSTIAQAAELIRIASEKKTILQVGHLERFNPAFTEALEKIKNPVFIEANRLSTFTGRSVDIDVVFDLMIHDIDLVLAIVKSPVREIRAHGIPFIIDKLDAASARIDFENGCVANLNASRVSIKKKRNLTVFEKDRYYFIDLLNGVLSTCLKNKSGTVDIIEATPERRDAVNEELTEFVRAIRQGTVPSVRGEDGLKALSIASEIINCIGERNYF